MASTNYTVITVSNGIFPSNTYILTDKDRDCSIIIDPGLDTEALRDSITQHDIKPVAVVATHGHFDHIGGVHPLQDQYGIPYYLHESDLKISKSANFYLKMVKLPVKITTPVPDYLFKEKEEIWNIAGFEFRVYNFPGHTEGSCVLQSGDFLFTGDILYKKGLGFNSFPGEDREKLRQTIRAIFSRFPDDTPVYPGHGDSTTLGIIKRENRELRHFIHLNDDTA